MNIKRLVTIAIWGGFIGIVGYFQYFKSDPERSEEEKYKSSLRLCTDMFPHYSKWARDEDRINIINERNFRVLSQEEYIKFNEPEKHRISTACEVTVDTLEGHSGKVYYSIGLKILGGREIHRLLKYDLNK